MTILGAILVLVGLGSAIYGVAQNNDVEAQVMSVFSSGSMNPGAMWIIGGCVAMAIGIVLVFINMKKKD